MLFGIVNNRNSVEGTRFLPPLHRYGARSKIAQTGPRFTTLGNSDPSMRFRSELVNVTFRGFDDGVAISYVKGHIAAMGNRNSQNRTPRRGNAGKIEGENSAEGNFAST